jgi:putative ABC transport system permease protein
MFRLQSIVAGLRALFRKEQAGREMDEELRAYLDAAVREKMRTGMSAEEARRSARVEMGSLEGVKEGIRSAGWESTLETLWQDLRYGMRQLRRNPGFTCVAVLTLALGIGANTAMFSVVNAVLLRPLPFSDPDRLVVVAGVSAGRSENWAEGTKTLANFSLYATGEVNLAGEGEADRVSGAVVSKHFFGIMGINPIKGRAFLPFEEAGENPFVAIISYELWHSRFGADPGLIGKTVHLNGKPFTVVGIMPPGFGFPGETQVWAPFPRNVSDYAFTGITYVSGQIARLRPGASLEQARAELRVYAQRHSPDDPKAAEQVSVVPLQDSMVRDIRPALLLLLAAVGFVLLIACANVANLFVARSAGRFREVAVRAALAASRARLVRQLLTESVLLSLMGGALGLLTSLWAMEAIRRLTPAGAIFRSGIRVDGWVLAFTFAVAVLTGIVSGLAPALQSSKPDLMEALKESATISHAGLSLGSRRRLRGLLGVFETATALALLIGAGLLIRSFAKLLDVNPGFRAQGLLAARVSLLEPRYRAPESVTAFFQEVLGRVKALPGVRDAAFANVLPFRHAGAVIVGLEPEGGPKWQPQTGPGASYLVVSTDYFQTMGIPLLLGRNFTERDTRGSTPVAIISQSLARGGWPGQNPLGKHFSYTRSREQPVEVVGVVGDVQDWDLAMEPFPQMYLPILQQPPDAAFLVIHSTQNPTVVSPALRGIVRAVDKNEPISSVTTMEQLISQSVTAPRFRTLLLGIFAGLAFLLAVVGIYGIVSYSVSQRTHEIGVRMALGAERRDVLGLVVGHGMGVTLIGIGVGLAASFGLTRLLSSFLFGVRPTDPLTFVIVAAIFIIVALLASYIPARRATKVDPIVALRYE